MGTLISQGRFLGAKAVILENDSLRCVCLPEHGGKIASLYHKKKGFELLFQNPRGVFRKADPGAVFGDFDACGFDDAFPNIDAERVRTARGEIAYFDHGEIWTAAFTYVIGDGGAQLTYQSPFLGYRYEKHIALHGNTLTLTYQIANESEYTFPCIWACHCLVNLKPGLRLLFPRGTKHVMTVMDTPLLGAANTVYRFPTDLVAGASTYDFSRAPAPDGTTMLKYYCTEAVREGCCGYRYEAEGVEVTFCYDPKRLPYLGYWATAGGYRGDCNCALEPTNGFYDSISAARRNHKCLELEPSAKLEFALNITIKQTPHT